MIDRVFSGVAAWLVGFIAATSYGGIVLLMALESACVPLPSEVTMPFSGYLAGSGRLSLNLVALAGTLGCLLGSYVAYYVGASGGRWLLLRYGRYVLISPHEVELAERFFDRWGAPAVFIARLLPIIRTFIALPAGIARMHLLRFTIYTIAGSYLWCLALAYVGMQLGAHWAALGPYFHRFDTFFALLILAVGAWLIYNRSKGLGLAGGARDEVECRTAPSQRASRASKRDG